ncbi:MAG: glycosyltransferase family 2 protein [Myxococcota bacterium]
MTLRATATFWGSAAFVGYTYIGYPLLLWTASRLRPKRVNRGPIEPTVSVVLAAHDEADNIGRKLDNLLELDYPPDKLEIIVVSDGSSDGTDDIVQRYVSEADAPSVLLSRNEEAAGKAMALNLGVARATGDVILFCDARQPIDRGALRALVRWFSDPQIGAVSGALQMGSDKGPGLYWAYEKLIREAESRFDSVVGATGALYAIRRALWRDLPRGTLLDDVYTPLHIALQGFRVTFEPDARVYDEEASIEGEFARKARTLAGNFQLMNLLPELWSPRRNRLFPQLVSHKIMRLACPYALVALYGANAYLVATRAPGWPFYAVTLAGQTLVYGAALRATVGGGEASGRLERVSHAFVTLNAAAVEGLRRYLASDLGWTSGR